MIVMPTPTSELAEALLELNARVAAMEREWTRGAVKQQAVLPENHKSARKLATTVPAATNHWWHKY